MVKITPGIGHTAPDVRNHGGAVGLTNSTTEELYSDAFDSGPRTMQDSGRWTISTDTWTEFSSCMSFVRSFQSFNVLMAAREDIYIMVCVCVCVCTS